MRKITFIALLLLTGFAKAQDSDNYKSEVWVADQGDGTYRNPIIHSDYSDPDVTRAGDDYYMTSSSFNPGQGMIII